MRRRLTNVSQGAYIKGGRRMLRLSQRELADLAGISASTVSRIERGYGGETETIKKLIRTLGSVSHTYFHQQPTTSLR